MFETQWYPANYTGFGIVDSRIYLTPRGQVLCVLAQDIDPERADPIVLACGLRPAGNGGECWCVAPLLSGAEAEPPFPNACFASVQQVEAYLLEQCGEPEAGLWAIDPIDEDELFAFYRFLQEDFSLPQV